MASTHKSLRSSTANKRPTTAIADGQIALNTNATSPGLFFKDSAGGTIIKVGPVHVGTTAPNATPAAGGSAGNSTGEVWLDTSLTPPGVKIWNGGAWTNATPAGSTTVQGLLELATNAETQTGSDAVRAVTPASLQSKVSDSTSTTSSTTIASSTAVKSAYDLANAALPKTGGTVTGNVTFGTTGVLAFEGSTDDGFETAIAVVDPTADNTITLPNVSGTVVTTGDTGTVTSTMIADGTIVNADINASAAIAPSKLGSGALPNGVTVSSTNIVDGTIVNADINASAAIAGTKISPNFGAQNVVTTGTSTAASFIPTSSTVPTNGVYLPAANNVALSTNGAGRLFVDGAGSVGIGTDGPNNLLHLYESNTTQTASSDSQLVIEKNNNSGISILSQNALSGHIYFGDSGDNDVGQITYNHSSNYMQFTTNGSERLRITSTGLVGIGTSSPGAILELQQSAATALRITRQNAVSNYCKIEAAGANSEQLTIETDPQNAGAGFIDFRNGAASKLRITSTGVGIGTTSPVAELSVTSGVNLPYSAQANAQLHINKSTGAAGMLIASDTIGNIFFADSAANNVGRIYYDHTSDFLAVHTNSTERARIDSSGRLLVGISSSITAFDAGLQVAGTSTGATSLHARFADNNAGPRLYLAKSRSSTVGVNTIVQSGDQCGTIDFRGADGTGYMRAAEISAEVDGTPGTNDMPGRLVFATTADGAYIPTERMRIDSAGLTYIGYSTITTSSKQTTAPHLIVYSNGSSSALAAGGYEANTTSTSTRHHISFSNPNGVVGSISTGASATAYNTSSDYRLKENVTQVTDGITRLQQLKPSRFNFIADPDTTVDGFIAHEVQGIVPEAITGEKDAVDDDGNPQYQGIDQSKLVPLLTAALQEAVAKIESLEARLTAAGL